MRFLRNIEIDSRAVSGAQFIKLVVRLLHRLNAGGHVQDLLNVSIGKKNHELSYYFADSERIDPLCSRRSRIEVSTTSRGFNRAILGLREPMISIDALTASIFG